MPRGLYCLAGVALFVACASSPPEPTTPTAPTRRLGLAFAPGPCIEGRNVLAASAFVTTTNAPTTYLQPTEGTLRLELLSGTTAMPVSVRWHDVAAPPERVLPAGPPWNLELSFVSPTAGECPIRVAFEPTPKAAATGLGSATTTIMLKAAPPPPQLPP